MGDLMQPTRQFQSWAPDLYTCNLESSLPERQLANHGLATFIDRLLIAGSDSNPADCETPRGTAHRRSRFYVTPSNLTRILPVAIGSPSPLSAIKRALKRLERFERLERLERDS